ncbi:hypothetical protein JKG47_09550 [Acidithiobacillus sp. MC6.1]|nr:hypothetical protein [Acidithiobacillus sp. MC6.1]
MTTPEPLFFHIPSPPKSGSSGIEPPPTRLSVKTSIDTDKIRDHGSNYRAADTENSPASTGTIFEQFY